MTSPMSPCPNCDRLKFPSFSQFQKFNITERLRSSQYPSSSEVNEIDQVLRSARHDVSRYDAEIGRLHSLLVSLENEQNRLHLYMDQCQALLSPVRKLPDEILSHIFSISGEDTSLIIDSGKEGANTPGCALAMVCSHWRTVALSTPELWSTFYMEGGLEEGVPDSRTFALTWLTAVLGRSRRHSLDITLWLPTSGPTDLHAVFTSLFAESSRFRNLTLVTDAFDNIWFQAGRRDFPLLEHLSCRGSLATDIFATAPRLHSVEIVAKRLLLVRLPWYQLTDLVYRELPLAQIFSSLSGCLKLRALTLDSISPPSHSDQTSLALPTSLRSLTVTARLQTQLKGIFSCLIAPSLTSLSVANVLYVLPWPETEFAVFLSRSSCTITELVLKKLDMSTESLTTLLRSLHSLKELTFSESSGDLAPVFTSPLLLNMSLHSPRGGFRAREPPLIPLLDRLDLSIRGAAFQDPDLVKMIKSRWRVRTASGDGYGGLCHVRIHVRDRTMDSGGLAVLKALRSSGLNICIKDKKHIKI